MNKLAKIQLLKQQMTEIYYLKINTKKQIIFLHIGQCGVQVSQSCWELFCLQHGISLNGKPINSNDNSLNPQVKNENNKQYTKGDVNTLFYESSSGKLIPRSLQVDLEPSVINQVKTSKYKQLFNPNLMISGKEDSANNYIRGHYTIGKQILDLFQDRLRKQIQMADYLEAIIMTHSINGGTGSGFGQLVMERNSVNLPKVPKINLSVFPSKNYSDTVVEPYNAVLSGHGLLQHSDLTIPFANESMYNIMEQQVGVEKPSYANINYLIAKTASNMTCSSRFQGQKNWSIIDLGTNLISYPRIHFITSSFNVFNNKNNKQLVIDKRQLNQKAGQVFDINNFLIDVKKQNSKYLSSFLMYRSESINYSDALMSARHARTSSNIKFVDWVPTGMSVGLNNSQNYVLKDSGYQKEAFCLNMLSVNMRIDSVFARINHKFDLMYSKRAFVHWYVGQGIDEGFFGEARQDLAALEKDFQDSSDHEWCFENEGYMDEQNIQQ